MKDNAQFPNVIHMGKTSRKAIKKYKKGYGKMFMEVQQVAERAKATAPAGENVLPIVVLHRKKIKKGAIPGAANALNFNF
jgi:hypothetical protein